VLAAAAHAFAGRVLNANPIWHPRATTLPGARRYSRESNSTSRAKALRSVQCDTHTAAATDGDAVLCTYQSDSPGIHLFSHFTSIPLLGSIIASATVF